MGRLCTASELFSRSDCLLCLKIESDVIVNRDVFLAKTLGL